jgi:hypothetical protein
MSGHRKPVLVGRGDWILHPPWRDRGVWRRVQECWRVQGRPDLLFIRCRPVRSGDLLGPPGLVVVPVTLLAVRRSGRCRICRQGGLLLTEDGVLREHLLPVALRRLGRPLNCSGVGGRPVRQGNWAAGPCFRAGGTPGG